ncbi:hypothetical protein F4604DRAFT_1905986 [Suillus subluteus]|nr:hypothetical protein F4604DRAFT_1905986 [Suillus subluteus]
MVICAPKFTSPQPLQLVQGVLVQACTEGALSCSIKASQFWDQLELGLLHNRQTETNSSIEDRKWGKHVDLDKLEGTFELHLNCQVVLEPFKIFLQEWVPRCGQSQRSSKARRALASHLLLLVKAIYPYWHHHDCQIKRKGLAQG